MAINEQRYHLSFSARREFSSPASVFSVVDRAVLLRDLMVYLVGPMFCREPKFEKIGTIRGFEPHQEPEIANLLPGYVAAGGLQWNSSGDLADGNGKIIARTYINPFALPPWHIMRWKRGCPAWLETAMNMCDDNTRKPFDYIFTTDEGMLVFGTRMSGASSMLKIFAERPDASGIDQYAYLAKLIVSGMLMSVAAGYDTEWYSAGEHLRRQYV